MSCLDACLRVCIYRVCVCTCVCEQLPFHPQTSVLSLQIFSGRVSRSAFIGEATIPLVHFLPWFTADAFAGFSKAVGSLSAKASFMEEPPIVALRKAKEMALAAMHTTANKDMLRTTNRRLALQAVTEAEEQESQMWEHRCTYRDLHTHTYTHTYKHTYAHAYIHTHIHTYIHTRHKYSSNSQHALMKMSSVLREVTVGLLQRLREISRNPVELQSWVRMVFPWSQKRLTELWQSSASILRLWAKPSATQTYELPQDIWSMQKANLQTWRTHWKGFHGTHLSKASWEVA